MSPKRSLAAASTSRMQKHRSQLTTLKSKNNPEESSKKPYNSEQPVEPLVVAKKEPETKKEIRYCKCGVKVGHGKYSPVELIVYKQQLFVLKKIPKHTIEKRKRIEHLKNEKAISRML